MVRKIMRLITAGVVSFVFVLPFVTTTTATATQKPIVAKEEKPKNTQEKEKENIVVAETADAASTTVSLESPEEMSNESALYTESEEVVLPIPEPVFDPEAIVNPAPETAPVPEPEPAPQGSPLLYGPYDFMSMGVLHWGGYRWTWYSQRVLPGGGLNIPGRHVDGNGYVSDGEGYICLASNDLPYGTIVDTPLGKPGRVYDCGCASGTLDVYVNW